MRRPAGCWHWGLIRLAISPPSKAAQLQLLAAPSSPQSLRLARIRLAAAPLRIPAQPIPLALRRRERAEPATAKFFHAADLVAALRPLVRSAFHNNRHGLLIMRHRAFSLLQVKMVPRSRVSRRPQQRPLTARDNPLYDKCPSLLPKNRAQLARFASGIGVCSEKAIRLRNLPLANELRISENLFGFSTSRKRGFRISVGGPLKEGHWEGTFG